MGLLDDIFGVVRAVARTVVDMAVEVTAHFVVEVQHRYRQLQAKYAECDVETLKQQRFSELQGVNDELQELQSRQHRDGKLNGEDRERLDVLLARRSVLRGKVDAAREFQQAQDIAEHGDDYQNRVVDPNNPNDLTRIAGQAILGKPCRRCGLPLALRWPTKVVNPTVADLFWGCTGYFVPDARGQRKCNGTEKLTQHDRRIFAVIRPGMELPQQNLHRIIENPAASAVIKKKLGNHLGQPGENYLCPTHHERMQLQEKRNPESVLDAFYLQCARCDQTVKIKSAAQLDEVMSQMGEGPLFAGGA